MSKRNAALRYTFDSLAFVADLEKCAKEFGVSVASVCRDVGIDQSHISWMKHRGSVPAGAVLAALAAWSGLDIKNYARLKSEAPTA